MCERHGREEEPALKGGPVWRGAIVDESGSCTEGARRAKAAHVAVRDVLRATPPPFHPGLASGGTSSPASSTADLLSRFGTSGSRSLGHRSGRKTRVAAKIFSFRIVELSRPEEAEDESRMSGDRERHALHGRAATPAVFGRPLTALLSPFPFSSEPLPPTCWTTHPRQ